MNPLYRTSLARLQVDAGQRDEAVQNLAAVYGEAMAHFQVCVLLNERREPELARQHLRQSLALNPNLPPAREMWERGQLAVGPARPGFSSPDRTTRLPFAQ